MNHMEIQPSVSSVAEKVTSSSKVTKLPKKSEATQVETVKHDTHSDLHVAEKADATASETAKEIPKETPKVAVQAPSSDSGFRFKVDPNHSSNEVVIEVLDKNGKVLKTIPSEEIKSMLEAMRKSGAEDRGLVLDLKS